MAKKAAQVRKSEENARARVGLLTLLLRGMLGLTILGGLALLSQPRVVEDLREAIAQRLPDGDGYRTHGGILRGDAKLAELFTPEVLYWRDDILRWGKERNLNPNLIATIIQIESCGDPYVSSNAGAQGLFQVMPLHFDSGENQLNPENNARNGIDHLVDCLQWSDYDVGLAFACYNGGPSLINLPREQWFAESQNYYKWGTGIYGDAASGKDSSPTLDEWLAAGGANLCRRARETQETILPQLAQKPQVDSP